MLMSLKPMRPVSSASSTPMGSPVCRSVTPRADLAASQDQRRLWPSLSAEFREYGFPWTTWSVAKLPRGSRRPRGHSSGMLRDRAVDAAPLRHHLSVYEDVEAIEQPGVSCQVRR